MRPHLRITLDIRRALQLSVTLGILSLLIAACGSSMSDGGSAETTTTAPAAGTSSTATSGAAPSSTNPAGYGSASSTPATSTPAPSATTTGASGTSGAATSMEGMTMLMRREDPKLGAILTDGKGMTLYFYTEDTPNTSNCDAECVSDWPPVPASGMPMLGNDVTGQLNTFKRADGFMQLTYNGKPLYYWIGDQHPGDVTGDGLEGFVVAKIGS